MTKIQIAWAQTDHPSYLHVTLDTSFVLSELEFLQHYLRPNACCLPWRAVATQMIQLMSNDGQAPGQDR